MSVKPVYVICLPVRLMACPFPGSTQRACPDCSDLLWVGPDSVEIVKHHKGAIVFLCPACLQKRTGFDVHDFVVNVLDVEEGPETDAIKAEIFGPDPENSN